MGALGVLAAAAAMAAGSSPAMAAASGHGAGVSVRTATAHAVHHGAHSIQTSSNWSGYAETGSGYTSIAGDWTVPTSKGKGGNKYQAEWLGIDGDGNQHLIQTGTQVDESGGSASYGAWWEILPAAETPINEPVSPGDQIEASIVKQSSGKWLITLEDVGRWTFTITKSYSGPGASAEWIVEAPEVGGSIASMNHTSKVTFDDLTVNGANPELVYATDAIACKQDKKIVESPSEPTGGNSFAMAYGAKTPKAPA